METVILIAVMTGLKTGTIGWARYAHFSQTPDIIIIIVNQLFYRQDSTYHGLCYTSYEALTGSRSISIDPQTGIDPAIHCMMNKYSTTELHCSPMGRFVFTKPVLEDVVFLMTVNVDVMSY